MPCLAALGTVSLRAGETVQALRRRGLRCRVGAWGIMSRGVWHRLHGDQTGSLCSRWFVPGRVSLPDVRRLSQETRLRSALENRKLQECAQAYHRLNSLGPQARQSSQGSRLQGAGLCPQSLGCYDDRQAFQQSISSSDIPYFNSLKIFMNPLVGRHFLKQSDSFFVPVRPDTYPS